jgi:hypothetical protein
MDFTIWVKKASVIQIKEEADKPPVITGKLSNPQILVDTNKATITVIETK